MYIYLSTSRGAGNRVGALQRNLQSESIDTYQPWEGPETADIDANLLEYF